MKAIKVLHVVSVDKENYYLNNLTDFTDPNEIEFSFATFYPQCDFGRELEKRGKRVYYLDCLQSSRYSQAFRKLREIYKAFSKLREIYKQENPDIIHTHLFDPTFIGLMAARWRKTVFTRHHSDATHEIASSLKRTFYLKLEAFNNRRADHIIAPSQMVRDILVEKENVPSKKVSLVPYGQTTERFDAVTKEKIEYVQAELDMKKNLALVCTSRLFPRKGHQYLFEAFADLREKGLDATLYLVGTGDYKGVLEKLAKDLQIEKRVKFLGWRDDALVIIAAADIIVHPSLEDALSSAVIESLMMEKPIIATDISGVRDTLNDGKYGKIVPPADAESFRAALSETIENLGSAREKAKEGRKYLLEYMSAERVAKEYTKIYQKLLQSN